MNKNVIQLRHAVCANCSSNFIVKDSFQLYGKRSPLLLQCGHSQCETCVRDSLKVNVKVICKICKNESACGSVSTLENLRNEFPLNIFLTGSLFLRAYKSKVGDPMISFKTKANTPARKTTASQNENCFECAEKSSDVSCKECNNTYCNVCFDAIHQKARALQLHQKLVLEKSQNFKFCVQFCSTHNDQKVEFRCKTCDENTCSYCALSNHIGHEVIHKQSENEKKLDEMKTKVERANSLCRRYQYLKKKAVTNKVLDSGNDKLASAEKLVSSHFDRLHALLQLQESKLLDELHKYCYKVDEARQNVIKDLDLSIEELKDVMTLCNEVQKLEKDLAWININDVIEKLDKIMSKPVYVGLKEPNYGCKESDDQGDIFSITNKTIFDVIINHCSVEVPSFMSYDLLCENDVPEDYEIEEIPVDDEPDVVILESIEKPPSSIASSSGCTSDKSSSKSSKINLDLNADSIGFKQSTPKLNSNTKSSISCEVDKVFCNQKANVPAISNEAGSKRFQFSNDLTPGSTESVKICHFMNPSDFFVHRKGADSAIVNLAKECQRMKIKYQKHPTEVNEGTLYFVQFQSDRQWYRGCVEKVENIERILIKYIDFGNKEYVSMESLRLLAGKFSLIPPMALHCKLYDCFPNSGLEWSTEAIKLMAGIIMGSQLTMHVMRIDNGSAKLEVDLTKFEDESRLSVRDALIFHEQASFITTNTISIEEHQLNRKWQFYTISNFKDGQIFEVIVTHVIDPSNFFIQIVNKRSYSLKNTTKQMNDFYKNNPTGSNCQGMVYSPYVGLQVAGFDHTGTWQRGQVTSLPGNRQIEVYFIDTGETKTLPWENIRILPNKFLRMSAQAIRCTLSDVIPANKAVYWSDISIKTFQDLVNKKKLKATVVAVLPDRLKIALYECSELVDTCLNALFVKSGCAESVGITSTLAEFPKYHEARGSAKSSSLLHKPYGRDNIQRQEVKKMNVKKKKPASTSSVQSEVSTEEENCITDGETGNNRYAVTIRSVVSPGHFYVSFNVQKQLINKLFKDMNEYYNTLKLTPDEDIEWEQGKVCAVFKKDKEQWYRGYIEKCLPEDNVKVLLKDIAETVIVNKSSLAELVEQFLEIRDGAFKCHLAGIVAAGGQDTWPGVAIDVFQEQIDGADKIFFTQKGDMDTVDKSIPAELWVRHTIIGGPLDPSREEWLLINKYLTDQGLALPVKSNSSVPVPSTSKDFFDKSSCSSSNLTDSDANVTEWMKKSELLNQKSSVPSVKIGSLKKSIKSNEPRKLEDANLPKEWLPPLPFNQLTFVGLPTYVDNNCNIFIQDVASANTLDIIQRALTSRFQDSKPMAHDLYWFPGQLCIAQYHADKKWYRAKVLEVNADNTVTVEMVDYGNIEVCRAAELRKNICMTHIPLQCHKCSFKQLHPVSENGKWPISVLDFIHGTIVEKICQIQLEGSEGGYNVVSLKCPGGLDLCEILLSMSYARYITNDPENEFDNDDDSPCIIIEDEQCSNISVRSLSPPIATGTGAVDQSSLTPEVGLSVDQTYLDPKMSWYDLVLRDEVKSEQGNYKDIVLPKDVDEFLVEISSIVSPISVVAQIYHVNPDPLAGMKNQFVHLQEMLQDLGQCQPQLSNYVTGEPCICQYSFDQKWYRGVIMDVLADDTVKVRYIDYGNIEIASKESVREIKKEWMEVPIQGLQCTFWGVKVADPSKVKKCVELLEENIFISPVLATIKERTPELKVELFKADGSVLVYNKLIEENVYELTEK